jgi:hypothetical protein
MFHGIIPIEENVKHNIVLKQIIGQSLRIFFFKKTIAEILFLKVKTNKKPEIIKKKSTALFALEIFCPNF